MRQLEMRGIKSPAYLAVQAQLELLGKRTKGDRGRRFSETGKATYAEMEILNKILSEFLEQKTSTIKGAKEYERNVWETANKNNKLSEVGISKDEWLDFWASMPDRKDRLFGSDEYVTILRTYIDKKATGQLEDEQKMTVEEIAEKIKEKDTLKAAWGAIGLTSSEIEAHRIEVNDD